ncbi:MAG TPA: type II secretion system F family protein [Actinomycetota bacterium]|nr:type II secretion system F family protein [Actinomycetota bacterium]
MTSTLPGPLLASASVALAVLAAAAHVRGGAIRTIRRGAREVPARETLVHRIGSLPFLVRISGGDRLRARIESSGGGRSHGSVVGTKALLAAVGGASSALLTGSVVASAVVGFVAFRVPDARLARAVRLRRARADRELPVFLDLLAAAAAAGLTGQLAVRRATEATEGPLAEELGTAFRRVDLGGRWRDELGAAADRLELPDLRRAAAILTRSDAIGSSLSEAVSELARESREARRAAVSERARKAPVKMLFPLVFLVLPAFLLLTVVPVLVTTVQSIR